jgi:predicted enzyme related to lactoylglutathione lyase
MSRIIHFEIHASQPQALIDYYTALLGWTFNQYEGADYWLIETGPSDEPGIDGGLLPRRGDPPLPMQAVNSFVCTAQVDSLDETLSKNAALGGSVAFPKMPIPRIGWLAYVKDPDGNIMGLMQPDANAK